MKRGFTLMEVNMAILIMSGGILAMASLFSLGYNENTKSREDVGAAALADAVMSPIVAALSQTNITWSTFNSIDNIPSDSGNTKGWGHFIDTNSGRVKSSTPSVSDAFSALSSVGVGSCPSLGKMKGGLVIRHQQNSPIIKIGFRAAAHQNQLLAAPLYYTEVHFQGTTN